MTKQPIVILHGWGSSPDRWEAIRTSLTELADGLQGEIFSPFLPGFDGKPIPKPYFIDDYVGWLNEYLKEHHIKKPILVGHSNGGRIAIRFAATHGGVEKLVLINSAGIPNTDISFKRRIFMVIAKVGKTLLFAIKGTPLYSFSEKLLYKAARESDYLKASPIMKKTMQNLLIYDATEDLAKISCPTLCIWGRNDSSTPIWMGEKIAAGIPHASLSIIEGGHNIHISHPKEVVSLISNFI